jgi:6-phospho-beta-glucosidase
MKIAVIGGGSTYTPELVNGFLEQVASLPLEELWLMDIDAARLDIVGGFARRMATAKGSPFKVVLSTNQREAVRGAAYVITQLRVGQMPARVADEYLGRRHGLIGQETTGIGGMAKALRTIPVVLDIAKDMRETAGQGQPLPLLLNFTNPSGLVTEALNRYAADVPSVGVCNGGITTKMFMLASLAEVLGSSQGSIAPERVVLHSLGLNHLTWYHSLTLDGEELWPKIFPAYLAQLRSETEPEWDVRTMEALGMIPNGYLQYFYYTDKKEKAQEEWPPSRGEEVLSIEKDLLRLYADSALTAPPPELMLRGGAFYSTLATQLIASHYNDLGLVEIVNVPNNEAVKEWPADWVLEMPCKIDRQGIHPLPAKPLPPACFGLVAQVKMYELLTVEAAVHGDRNSAYQALLAHPLGPKAVKVQEVLEDMLETHKKYLPQFYK